MSHSKRKYDNYFCIKTPLHDYERKFEIKFKTSKDLSSVNFRNIRSHQWSTSIDDAEIHLEAMLKSNNERMKEIGRVASNIIAMMQHEMDVPDGNEKARAPSELAAFAFYLMPAEKLEDALANLDEIYESRLLPKVCKGNLKKARRIYLFQVLHIVLGHYGNRLKASALAIAGYFGLSHLAGFLKRLL